MAQEQKYLRNPSKFIIKIAFKYSNIIINLIPF